MPVFLNMAEFLNKNIATGDWSSMFSLCSIQVLRPNRPGTKL